MLMESRHVSFWGSLPNDEDGFWMNETFGNWKLQINCMMESTNGCWRLQVTEEYQFKKLSLDMGFSIVLTRLRHWSIEF